MCCTARFVIFPTFPRLLVATRELRLHTSERSEPALCHSLTLFAKPVERRAHSPREYRAWALMVLVTLICAPARVLP